MLRERHPSVSGHDCDDTDPHVNSLRAFDCQSTTGSWTIEIADTIGGNIGTLNDWRLEFGVSCE
ncbi:MAG: subtilisin-like proprotein convertase family protein [Bradymonadia bacterium]|jgi:subtilisin-like proprotein convertase family protein